jgi:hypothetical protein
MTNLEITGKFSSNLVSSAPMTVLITYAPSTGPAFIIYEFGRTKVVGFENETITVAFQDKIKQIIPPRKNRSRYVIYSS